MSRLLQAMKSGRVLLMDGAMGTELQRAGLKPGECGESWNLSRPEEVRAIHRAYAESGAEVLLTNTFQADEIALARHGRAEDQLAIRAKALWLARSVSGPDRFVLADVGPVVTLPRYREFGDRNVVKRTVASVGNSDALLIETCSTSRVLYATWTAAQETQQPVLLSLTFRRDPVRGLVTLNGRTPEWFAGRAAGYGASALGVNCGRDIGMDDVIEIIRRYRQATDLPLFARPNAGTPAKVGDRWVYPHTPEQMAGRLPELLLAGITMIGGCCGTTPEHIAAFRPIIREWNTRHAPS
jgi:5-methyltetrahydrofolate--homocysteine methyltransferase